MQTKENLILTGVVTIIFGFIARKSWEGIMLAMLGLWVFCSGLTSYLNLPINYFSTGISIVLISLFCGTINLRSQFIKRAG